MGEAPEVESGSVSGSGGSFQTDAPRSAGAAALWKPRGTGSLGCLVSSEVMAASPGIWH